MVAELVAVVVAAAVVGLSDIGPAAAGGGTPVVVAETTPGTEEGFKAAA